MLDDGAIGRGDPSVRHHFRDSVSDTMRITDLAAPRKIPPGTGWRKFGYSVSFHKINPGESPRERHYRNLQGRIRRQYVITVVSGKGGVGVTTMAACIGGVFRECRPENVIAIDAVPSFGTLADRIGRDGGDRMFAPVTSLTAAHTAMAIIAMAVGVVLALTLRTRTITDSPVPAAMAGGIGVLLVIGALVVWWGWRERRDLFSGFGWLAVVLLAVAAACAPPGALGAAHALIGLVVVVLGAITIGVATRKRWQTAVVTAVVTVCGILAAVAAVRMFRPVSMQVLAICVLVGLLVLIRMTPTVALWVARVRPPHFGSITGRDLFARRAGMPVDTVAPVSEADADDEDNELTDITARGTAIAASARLVNAVQVGMCVGVSLVLPAAVWGVLTPRQPWAWLALLVAGLTVGLFITQGRGFAAKYQAVALVCGASAAVCAGVLKYALDTPKGVQTGLLWPAIFVAAFAALGLAVALVVPATRFRPIIRLTVEWLEVLAMIALLPAAAALGGLFAWLRH